MSQQNHFSEFAAKMDKAGIRPPAIEAFRNNYAQLLAGKTGLIPESAIQPVETLPALESVCLHQDPALLAQTVMIKLNGGLGTGMGLAGPKSLLPIKNGLSFLDFIARQVLHLRQKSGTPLRFLLMNSFSTSAETLAHLKRYPELGAPDQLEFVQNSVPKIDATTFRPVASPDSPQLEWCPPGHGDFYPSLLGSGWLDRLLAQGVRYLFVSNADNLGASLDLGLLTWFAQSNQSFLMEVCERTAADKKGGHLARNAQGRLLLRESAQCPEDDLASFQDIRRHRFFNTNNLWIQADSLKEVLDKNGGIVPLPMIKNSKTVDPRDKQSTPVYQLETAMGAAIESFDPSGAVVVPRSRFAPVKTTADLLALRSDAYDITEDWRLELSPACQGQAPLVDLDEDHYKLVDHLDALTPGVPSLKQCRELKVRGPVYFNDQVLCRGRVTFHNPGSQPWKVPAGTYEDRCETRP